MPPFLPKLIEALEDDNVLADAGYCSKRNIKVVRDIDAAPVITDNQEKR
jgi:hypothetical protein